MYSKLKWQRMYSFIFISLLLYLLFLIFNTNKNCTVSLGRAEWRPEPVYFRPRKCIPQHSHIYREISLTSLVQSPSKVTPCLNYRHGCKKNISSQFHKTDSQLLTQLYEIWIWTSILIFNHTNKHSGIPDDATSLGLVPPYDEILV